MSRPGTDAPAITALVQEIDALSDQLRAARGIVDSGELVDLQGLDGEVDRLCRAVQAAKHPPASPAAAAMKRLLESLDGLRASVARQRQSVSDSLKNVSARKQAVSAYGRVPTKPRR